MREAGGFGIAPVAPQGDYAAVMEHVAGAIATIAPHDSQARFEGLGVTVIRAHGRFTGPRTVVADGTAITARRVVIAAGAADTSAAPPSEDALFSSTTASTSSSAFSALPATGAAAV